uniref:2-methoxy-6-polyprenyl-1,4-benzoquinol methylase, mitochondrial n=1 Tax=Mantoniella antarctica TaxID=81844 RepID=A0A7S0XBT0_9CHLO|mmetsp:Transcript_33492/g.84371  ORF Transcript_33492/g.84371 Transcript_33492/m.84371 type:complete len:352 (+) Transcript_33492:196-1251(+)
MLRNAVSRGGWLVNSARAASVAAPPSCQLSPRDPYGQSQSTVSSTSPSSLLLSARRWMSSSSSSSPEDASEPSSSASPGGTTSFGFRSVNTEEKEGLVRGVFEKVAPSYDLMNDVMSAGVHRVWKDYLVSKVGVFPGMTHLDVAGGTGDVAFRVLRALRTAEATARTGGAAGGPALSAGKVIVSDINPWMLDEGRKRADKLGLSRRVDARGGAVAALSFVEGNAECLPFEDESTDVYTIAFGLRNVTNTLAALKDAHRLLRPGGRFMCLEFSHVTQEPLRSIYEAYSFNVIPALGGLVANDKASYQYLVESIRKFPKQEELEELMREAGFRSVSHENITGGVVAIHSGFKL